VASHHQQRKRGPKDEAASPSDVGAEVERAWRERQRHGGVMTPDLHPLGLMLRGELRQARKNIVGAQVTADGIVEVEFFGPRGLR